VQPRIDASAGKQANLVRAAIAELIGTFFLVLIGTAVATATILNRETAGAAYDSLAIALSFGLVLAAIVGALGQVSGAHVNPAVTIGLASAGKFPWSSVPAYVVAQIAGGLLAALTVWAAYGQAALDRANLGAPAPVPETTTLQGILVEGLIAFLLVFVVIAVATDDRAPAGIAPLCIGFALAAGVLLGGPVSGGAGTGARPDGRVRHLGHLGDLSGRTGHRWYRRRPDLCAHRRSGFATGDARRGPGKRDRRSARRRPEDVVG